MNKQLRLFERPTIDLLKKLIKESKEKKTVGYHWNGEPWKWESSTSIFSGRMRLAG